MKRPSGFYIIGFLAGVVASQVAFRVFIDRSHWSSWQGDKAMIIGALTLLYWAGLTMVALHRSKSRS